MEENEIMVNEEVMTEPEVVEEKIGIGTGAAIGIGALLAAGAYFGGKKIASLWKKHKAKKEIGDILKDYGPLNQTNEETEEPNSEEE